MFCNNNNKQVLEVVLVLVVLLGVVPFSQQQLQCPPLSCAAVGANCVSSATVSYQCDTGSYCNSSVCVAYIAPGQPCTLQDECVSGYTCNASVCVKGGSYREPGSSCTAGLDYCEYHPTIICPASGICPVDGGGQRCYSGTCSTGYYCNATTTGTSGVCLPTLPNGSPCPGQVNVDSVCTSQSCLPATATTYKCADGNSVPVGGLCEYFGSCVAGAYCDTSGGGSNGSDVGVCKTAHAASYKSCTMDSDCTAPGELCVCGGGHSYCAIFYYLHPSELDLAACYQKYQCTTTDCEITNCLPSLCAFTRDYDTFPWTATDMARLSSCYYSADDVKVYNLCKGYFSSNAVVTVALASPLLLLLVVVVGMLFLML